MTDDLTWPSRPPEDWRGVRVTRAELMAGVESPPELVEAMIEVMGMASSVGRAFLLIEIVHTPSAEDAAED